jgi:hypothetical protein
VRASRAVIARVTAIAVGLVWLSPGLAAGRQADTRHSVSAETGLATWETESRGTHFRLTQISPAQARAFMQGRGMDEISVNEFANTCVFMSVLRNDGRKPIKFNLATWRYVPKGGEPRRMLTKEAWLDRWQPRNFSAAVRIAFAWSQFPVEQTFEPGDWNQGMTTYDLPAGSRFDVIYRWRQDGRQHEGRLKNVECVQPSD